MPPDTVAALLRDARGRLAAASATPDLDARLLLQSAAGLSHADVIADPGRRLAACACDRFAAALARRLAHEPVSRILGQREFYGRPFQLTPDVLDPRPDTETLIDAALPLLASGARLRDLGTGSGAIAVTLLAERGDVTGVATDLSPQALEVARRNAAALGVLSRLDLVAGSWFDAVDGRFDLVVSNPPYIPLADIGGLARDVRDFDPLLALDGGPDGLAPFRIIAAGAGAVLNPGGKIVVELGAGQDVEVAGLFADLGYRCRGEYRDLGGHVRCLAFAVA